MTNNYIQHSVWVSWFTWTLMRLNHLLVLHVALVHGKISQMLPVCIGRFWAHCWVISLSLHFNCGLCKWLPQFQQAHRCQQSYVIFNFSARPRFIVHPNYPTTTHFRHLQFICGEHKTKKIWLKIVPV